MDVLFKSILVVIVILIVFLIGVPIYNWADTNGLESREGVAFVIKKEFVASHTTYIYQKVGQTSVMTPIYHPDRWYTEVDIFGDVSRISITEDLYNGVSNDDEIGIFYVVGRYSKKNRFLNLMNE